MRFFQSLLSLLLLLLVTQTNAQTYPVQVSVSTTPPYYNFLSHFGDQNNHLLIVATLTDFNSPPVNVRLRLRIEGSGFATQTRQDLPVGPVFELTPGFPVFIQGSDLLPLLQENNLAILSGSPNFNNLPEGFTTICVDVIKDGVGGEVLATNNCTAFFLQLMQPPQAFLPICNSVVDTSSLFQTFQWSPPQNYIPAIGTDLNYTFSLYEWIDTTNFNIFQTGQGLVYQTQTALPMVQVSNFDLAWQKGRKYVWRVQSELASNGIPVQMITNNGLSTPCSFYYGKPQMLAEALTGGLTINLSAEALSTRKGKASWTVVDETPGAGLSTYSSYIVEYRRKPQAGENYVYPWWEDTVSTFQLPIYQLEPEKTYQVRVSGLAGNYRSAPTEIAEFTTPPAREYLCDEADLPYLPNNYVPLANAHMGDVFQIGQFSLEVKDIIPLGTPGHFKGRGTIPHSFISGARIKVRFDDLLVDSEYNVREGAAQAVTDGVDNWLNDQYLDQATPYPVNGTIESGGYLNDSTVFVVVNGDSLFFQFDGSDLPIVIHGDNNVEYQFWPDGTMIVTTYGIIPSNDQLDATKNLYVHFEPALATDVTFDKKNYSQFADSYEAIVCAEQFLYFVPNKSKDITGTEQVKAIIHGTIPSFLPSELTFPIAGGNAVVPYSQINDSTFLLTLPARSYNYQVYADYSDLKLGKVNVKSYAPLTKKVHIVPLVPMNGITETQLETELNALNKGANLTIDATITPQFNTPEFTSTTSFANPDVTLMSKYTVQMRALRDAYLAENQVESGTYLVFVLPSFADSQLDGYMVRGRGVGFVTASTLSSLPVFAHTLAHELGHGIGGLEHAWGDTESLKGSTDNLMDYSGGTRLVKEQWEGLRNETAVIAIFDEEEESSLLTTDYFEESLLNTSSEVYVSSSTISTNDLFKAGNGLYFKFSAEQLAIIDIVIIKNGVVTTVFEHSGKEYKIATSSYNFSSSIVQESAIVLFYDNSIPNRSYTKTVGNETYYLKKRDQTDITIAEFVPCNNVGTYIYGFENNALKRRSPICPEPEDSTTCNWTSNFALNNVGACAFRINRSSIQCLKQVPTSTKQSLISLLANKIIDMSESSNQTAYNSINFEELGVEAPGWFPGIFNDGGAYDIGLAFLKLMEASVEQTEMSVYLRNEFSVNQYELLRKFLVDWNFYEVTYPLIQLTNGLGGNDIASNRTTSVNIYGKTFTRSILTDPYVIGSENSSVLSDQFGCDYTASTQRMSMLGTGTIQSNASFIERFKFFISKQEFQNNGGNATPYLILHNNNTIMGTPVLISINGQQFTGSEYQDCYIINIPRTYSYSGKQLDPFELLTFIFTENHNSLGIEKGKPYIMPAIWGLCMEKAIHDEQEELEGRVFADKLMSFGGIILAPFTGGASLGLTFATVGVAEYDLAYQEIQQNQTLQQYQDDETFRNAWNTVYTTVQIVDALVAAPAVLNSLDDLFRAIRQSKHLEAAKQYVNDGFFNFVKGSLANVDEVSDFVSALPANIRKIHLNLNEAGTPFVFENNKIIYKTFSGAPFGKIENGDFVITVPKTEIPPRNEYMSQAFINSRNSNFQQQGAGFIVVKSWIEGGNPLNITLPPRKFVGIQNEMDAIISEYLESANDWTILRDKLNLGSSTDLSAEEIYYITIDANDVRFSFDVPHGQEVGAIVGEWVPSGITKNGVKEAALVGAEDIIHNKNINELLNQFSGQWIKIK